eukprot:GILJ01003537.1.p1 GENE.GILJ01003537.1~~GILJ01003537.1.p1  ORF type:complete len:897 (+),score=138.74 GILJ01003537.1:235-2691(+)
MRRQTSNGSRVGSSAGRDIDRHVQGYVGATHAPSIGALDRDAGRGSVYGERPYPPSFATQALPDVSHVDVRVAVPPANYGYSSYDQFNQVGSTSAIPATMYSSNIGYGDPLPVSAVSSRPLRDPTAPPPPRQSMLEPSPMQRGSFTPATSYDQFNQIAAVPVPAAPVVSNGFYETVAAQSQPASRNAKTPPFETVASRSSARVPVSTSETAFLSGAVYHRRTPIPSALKGDKPLQLVSTENGEFKLNEEAIRIISQIEGKIGVISVAGLYRTGKSFALNILLDRVGEGYGFEVGPTVKACTQGIWIWGRPIRDEERDITYILLDSEGTGSFERDPTHDSKLFALVVLISSYFVYNSVGVIDEGAIHNLSLVANLSKNIQLKAREEANQQTDDYALAAHTPKFLWLLRDFALDLVDVDGHRITPQQYLELALMDQDNSRLTDNNRIRHAIVHFFRQRDCVTLVRPVVEEGQIRNLSRMSLNQLRPEFQQQVKQLREKVFGEVEPKQHLGRYINGRMLMGLLRQYVQAINTGAVPNISSAWDSVVEAECSNAKTAAEDRLRDAHVQILTGNRLPLDDEQLEEALVNIRKDVTALFRSRVVGGDVSAQRFKRELKESIRIEEDGIRRKNTEASIKFCKTQLDGLYTSSIGAKIAKNRYGENDIDVLMQDWGTLLAKYLTVARGPAKLSVLVDHLSKKQEEGVQQLIQGVKAGYAAERLRLENDRAKLQEMASNANREVESVRQRETLLAQQVAQMQSVLNQSQREELALQRKLKEADDTASRARAAQKEREREARVLRNDLDRVNVTVLPNANQSKCCILQ